MELKLEINNNNYGAVIKVYEQLKAAIAEYESQPKESADDWPMSIDDLPKREDFWYINEFGDAKKADVSSKCRHTPGQYDSEADAKSAVAFSELSRLIRHINKGWVPYFDTYGFSAYGVYADKGDNKIKVFEWTKTVNFPQCLFFKNEANALKSIETHRQLWLDYFQVNETQD